MSRTNTYYIIKVAIVISTTIAALFVSTQKCNSQELEPRSLTNLPLKTTFLSANYAYASGNVLYDPSLPIEDLNASTHGFVGAYVRSFNFFGVGSKAMVMLPYVMGDWEGKYQNIDTSTSRSGMADLRMGFSINFKGSPALNIEQFKAFKQKTIAGFSFQMVAPTGQYYNDKLINLGSNRWAFRPQLGISHRINNWYIESSINVWLFTPNNDFLEGSTLEQNAIGTMKLHLIKTFNNGIWAALGAGYAYGGRAYVNGLRKDATISTIRFGGIASLPLNKHSSIKIMAIKAVRFAEGADFTALNISYQYMLNKNL